MRRSWDEPPAERNSRRGMTLATLWTAIGEPSNPLRIRRPCETCSDARYGPAPAGNDAGGPQLNGEASPSMGPFGRTHDRHAVPGPRSSPSSSTSSWETSCSMVPARSRPASGATVLPAPSLPLQRSRRRRHTWRLCRASPHTAVAASSSIAFALTAFTIWREPHVPLDDSSAGSAENEERHCFEARYPRSRPPSSPNGRTWGQLAAAPHSPRVPARPAWYGSPLHRRWRRKRFSLRRSARLCIDTHHSERSMGRSVPRRRAGAVFRISNPRLNAARAVGAIAPLFTGDSNGDEKQIEDTKRRRAQRAKPSTRATSRAKVVVEREHGPVKWIMPTMESAYARLGSTSPVVEGGAASMSSARKPPAAKGFRS